MNIIKKIEKEIEEILQEEKEIKKRAEEINIPVYKNKEKEILVMSGGGIRGIVHVGVLKALEEYRILEKIKKYAGTSIGTIIIGLYIFGYEPKELWEFIKEYNFRNTQEINILEIFENYGIDSGKKFKELIKKLMLKKNINTEITMKELYNKTKKEFIITRVCINDNSIEYISYKKYPHIKVLDAMMSSMSIPFIYKPIKENEKYYVDGGILDNYPITIFDEEIEKVIGIHIKEKNKEEQKISNFEDYIKSILYCFIEGKQNNNIEKYKKYTIEIHLDNINPLNFNLSKEDKEKIYKIGFNKTIEYIKKNKLKKD